MLNTMKNATKPNFKNSDRLKISKYKIIFAKWYTKNWSTDVSVVGRIKDTIPWTYVISDINTGNIAGSFYENESQKCSQEKFRIKKLIKRKGDKLFIKYKGYDN